MLLVHSGKRFCAAAVVSVNVMSAISSVGADKRPNVVLFLSDDHGWRDSGVYGDSYIRTPNIDKLATEGMRFTRAFATTPLCSPSRCTIETGLMPFHNGGHKFGTPIKPGIVTMPVYFKKHGYYTAHIGKFHHAPNRQFPYDFVSRKDTAAPRFIANYKSDKPLLLVVCTHPPHTPWVKNNGYDPDKIKLPPNFIDTPETRQDRARYYSDVTLMDSMLGDVLRALDKKGMREDTFFVYTTDQGANWPFAKWCVYDEGLHVPFIVRWPGYVKSGSISDAMISLVDLLPTFMNVAGITPPEKLDGRSIVTVVTGAEKGFRKAVFGTHTGNDNGGPGVANHCPARTIRTGKYRYIENLSPETTFTTHITGCKSGPHYLPFWDSWVAKAKHDPLAKKTVDRYLHRPSEELYDVDKDPYEMNNLANNPEYAEVVKRLRERLDEWRRQQDDPVPVNDNE